MMMLTFGFMATSPCNSLNVTPILNSRPAAVIGLPYPWKHPTRREPETGTDVCVDNLIADFARAVRTDFAPVASRAGLKSPRRGRCSKTRLERELGICFELVVHT